MTNTPQVSRPTSATSATSADSMTPAMALALSSNFASVAHWREGFMALFAVHGNQPGRVELAFVAHDGSLVNRWLPTHAASDAAVLLAMTTPAGADADADAAADAAADADAAAAAAAAAFTASIDWAPVYQRYQDAVHAASEPFAAAQGDVGTVDESLLLDVRRAGVFDAATAMLPSATWRDPASVADWAGELPSGRTVVVYCVYGHEVGRVTAMRLRARGVNARFLDGGIDAWQRAGLRTVPKGDAS